MARPVSRMSVNQCNSNIIVKLLNQSLNSCESMVQSVSPESRFCIPCIYILFMLNLTKFVIVTCGGENGTNGSLFLVFSEDVAFAHARYFVATRPPPFVHPIGMLVVFAMSVKNYLKW